MSRLTPETGFVVAMDVLGTREAPDPEDFLRRWGKLSRASKKLSADLNRGGIYGAFLGSLFAGELSQQGRDVLVAQPEKGAIQSVPLTVARTLVLGDTLVMAFKEMEGASGMQTLGTLLYGLFVKALRLRLFIRGAIGWGTFYQQEDTIVGPAVTDAFDLHDAVDWIGVVLTQTSGLRYERDNPNVTSPRWRGGFVRYPVPLKDGRKVPLYALDWPYLPDSPHRVDLADWFTANPIPLKAESKYRNTLEFFDTIRARGKYESGLNEKPAIGRRSRE